MKALIYVTHLLGTGHLARALVLARSMVADGHHVSVISGGMPVPHMDTTDVAFVQLPPLRSDGVNFTRLLDAEGNEASVAYLSKRAGTAVGYLRGTQPDVVLTELFPFGRRILSAEFSAILETARQMQPRPLICCSIRDILAPPSKPAKAEAADQMVSQFYDAVLVHSDPTITPLDASWPVSDRLREKLIYTGFVAPPRAGAHPQSAGDGEILVSAGGASVGDALFASVLSAAAQEPTLRWHLLVGGSDSWAKAAALRTDAPASVVVETLRPDFRSMLYHASASVSLCGYNTALDVLQAGTPAIFVPFDAGGETEQTLRANTLASLDGIEVLRSDVLGPDALLSAVKACLAASKRYPIQQSMDGAATTTRVLLRLLEARA